MWVMMMGSAWACGGFFCDSPADPVVQSAERILFAVDEEAGTTTTYVEIQFQGPPIQFGWVLPVPPGLTADDLSTAPAGLFDDLEEGTAPRFVQASFASADAMAPPAYGCSGPFLRRGDGVAYGYDAGPPDFTGVDVVGGAVVGPYAIELVEADSGDVFQQWLLFNGYQMPTTAVEPLQYYIDSGMNFIAVQLLPTTPSGPIDTLVFTTPGTLPMIPLRLTAIAASQDMDILAYTLSQDRMAPTNFTDLDFDWGLVNWEYEGGTDYDDELRAAVYGAGGRAFNTEFAGPTASIDAASEAEATLLSRGAYLTRFHTRISPADMVDDPMWAPAPDLPDENNFHAVDWYETSNQSGIPGWLGLVLLPLVGWGRRRRG